MVFKFSSSDEPESLLKKKLKEEERDFHTSSQGYIEQYRKAKTETEREHILCMLSDDDLAVLDALLKHIIDLETWIKDAKGVLRHG